MISHTAKGPFFSRDRRLYRTFFPLLLVISLQQLAALTVNLADNIMLGRYTELALSGATLVNQIQFVLQSVIHGIGMGVSVLGSQYWGKRDIDPIRRITSIGVKFAFLIGLIFMLATKLFPETVVGLFTHDQTVIAEAVKYLDIMCWTYIVFALANTLMYSLQSVETAFIGTIMSISTIIINVCLNYCFIYGNFGFPELGIKGAAFATLTSRTVELIIILVYILFIDKKLKLKVKHIVGVDFGYLKDFVSAAMPVMISGALWGVAQGAQTAILGHLNATVIAANSVASVIFSIFVVVGMSCASASSVTIGKTVGEGRMEDVRSYSRTLQVIFLAIGIVSGVAMILFREFIVSFYSISEEAKNLAMDFLVILGITSMGSCYEYPVEGGIIAGGGDPKFQAIMDNLFMWLFTIPVAAAAAFIFDASPIIVFWCLKLDQLLKCIPNFIVCNRYKWLKNLTREEVSE